MDELKIDCKYFLGCGTYGILKGINQMGLAYFVIEENYGAFVAEYDGYYYFGPGALENLVLINDFKFLK